LVSRSSEFKVRIPGDAIKKGAHKCAPFYMYKNDLFMNFVLKNIYTSI
jgi:hypothetical protein